MGLEGGREGGGKAVLPLFPMQKPRLPAQLWEAGLLDADLSLPGSESWASH